MMISVFHIISGLKVGGAEMALLRLINSSRNSGYKHVVVSLTPEGGMKQRFEEENIQLIILNFKKSPIRSLFSLLSLLRKQKPEIVQTWLYHSDLLGGIAARLAGIRNIIWGIRATALTDDASRLALIALKICARLSYFVPHTIVCVAEAARISHVKHGYDQSRMTVIHNGFDLAYLNLASDQRVALRVQCGFSDDEIVIGAVGRFHSDKDYKNFIDAAKLLAAENNHVRFLLLGRNITYDNQLLSAWLYETGCADRFTLLGERNDVPSCLAAMDIFCLSSRTEGFPNVVGEAMAIGLPCVVTDVGDAALLVGSSGVIVPKENPEALTDGLKQIVNLPIEQRLALGSEAKDRITTEFSMQIVWKRFQTVYRHVMAE